MKFGTWTNSNSMDVFKFSGFGQKYHFRSNFVQILKQIRFANQKFIVPAEM